MMSFSKLRKSRLTMMLVATAWLPYMLVCCVVDPFEASTGSAPKCHVLASLLPSSTEAETHSAHSGHHGAQHGAVSHHSDSRDSHDTSPAQTCCELTGKANVTVEKSVDFGAQSAIVTAALAVSEPTSPERLARTVALIDVHEHGPPLYLRNASFLI